MKGEERHGWRGLTPSSTTVSTPGFAGLPASPLQQSIIMALHYVMHAKPADPAAKHDDVRGF